MPAFRSLFTHARAPMLLLPLLVLAAGAGTPHAAEGLPNPASDLVRAGLAALGSEEALRAGRRVSFSQVGHARSIEQGRSPHEREVQTARAAQYIIDAENGRLRLETQTVFPGDIRFNTLLVLERDHGFSVDLIGWRLGSDVTRVPAPAAAANLAAGNRVLPHLLLQQALSNDSTLVDRGEVVHDGERLRSVSYRLFGAEIIVHLDAASHLVRRYAVVRGQQRSEVAFSDYREVEGLRLPHRFESSLNGEVLQLTRVELQPRITSSMFALPPGYSDPPPPGEPSVVSLAEGVFKLQGMPNDYHSVFVDMGDHVVVMEAPVSPAFAEIALRLIGETLPGRPVRYVLVTHPHGDHVGGLPPFIEQGATIVTAAGNEVALRRQLGALGDRAVIETVGAPRTLGEGQRRIAIHPVPTSHSDGNLVFHLPHERILFQGDLLYVPERGEVPPAFEMAEPLARAIRANGMAVDRIVGVHGRAATMRDLDRAVELRATQRR